MARVKRGVTVRRRHNKVLKAVKGYSGRRKSTIRVALQARDRALQYSYRDRRNRKRQFRALWIQRINAAARERGLTYSRLMAGLRAASVAMDRKNLSELAIHNPEAFSELLTVVKQPPA